ncbi:hypothetical protein [Nostoc sp. 'Peltigera membranacea cyanobiont' 210A]|nr:hypothetical protein [Nostoc sp. 'Peltigera membranacea cyanobiont' 210A]
MTQLYLELADELAACLLVFEKCHERYRDSLDNCLSSFVFDNYLRKKCPG